MDMDTPVRQPITPQEKHSRKKGWIILIGILLVCAVVSGFLLTRKENQQTTKISTQASAESTSSILTYANQQYHYSVQYPSDFTLQVVDGGGLGLRSSNGLIMLTVSNDTQDLAGCLTTGDVGSDELSNIGTTTINGVSFFTFRFTNKFNSSGFSDNFRTIQYGNCYGLSIIHTSQSSDTRMDGIVQSFRFLQ